MGLRRNNISSPILNNTKKRLHVDHIWEYERWLRETADHNYRQFVKHDLWRGSMAPRPPYD